MLLYLDGSDSSTDYAARAGVDLLHSLANTAPGWGRYRRAVTIHDLHYRLVPEAHLGVLLGRVRAAIDESGAQRTPMSPREAASLPGTERRVA